MLLTEKDIREIQAEVVKAANRENIYLLPSMYKKMFIKEAKKKGFSEEDCYNIDKEMAFEKLKDKSNQIKDKKMNDIYAAIEDTAEKLVIYLDEGKNGLDSSINSLKNKDDNIDFHLNDFMKHYSNFTNKILEIKSNVSNLEDSINSIKEMSIQDPLTSLGNCKYFEMAFEGELYSLKRYKTPVTFVLLRMKNIAQIKNKFSESIANIIIKTFASILYENIRASDTLCRCNNEDFRILLHNSDVEKGKMFIQKIKHTLSKIVFQKGDEKIKINFLYGLLPIKESDTIERILMRINLSA